MKLTVQYENLSTEETNELRDALCGYIIKICDFGNGPTLFVGAHKEDIVRVLEITTKYPYRSLLLNQC